MKKVLITTSSFGSESTEPLNLMQTAGFEYILNPYKRKLTEEELISLLLEHKPQYLIAGTETISKKSLELMKEKVEIISRCGTGLDNVDCEYAEKINISVKNTPDAPTLAVAELTIGIILDLLRKISFCGKVIRDNKFEKPMGNLLSGKTVGLVGCGRIGTKVAELLKSFNCTLIGYDSAIKKHTLIEIKSFDEVIKQSDIISLHIPYSNRNTYIINKEVLSKMKKTSFLINAARGGLIDENALIRALENKQIAGAGIDCFEKEPYSGDLIKFDNVVLTSHIGSYAKEARIKQEIDAVKNILENVQ
jgi:D-3-phosphoglycerate dehydrogenase